VPLRPDLELIADLVPQGSRVLDLGCGDGALLDHLIGSLGCRGWGVELSEEGFHGCLARGVPVVQGDLDRGLEDVEDDEVDVVILSETIQALRRPELVLSEMRRVAKRGIVSLPNFGHWRLRLELLTRGRMPSSPELPNPWFSTPNIHLCTLEDFERLVADSGLRIVRRLPLDSDHTAASGAVLLRPNLLAAGAVYALERS
jgi:methionine biosynthesis protein MetW